MNKEILMIAAMTSGGLLGSLGGTIWKPIRRFFLPLVLGVIAFLAGFAWWKCLIYTLLTVGAFSLGYGEKRPYWYKFIVGIAFVFPTLIFGLTIWQIITPLIWVLFFKLSNTKWLSDEFVWKVVEFVSFCFVGVTLAVLIGKYT